MQVFIKILKIILGIVLGLLSSFLIILGLDAVIDEPLVGIGKEYDLWFIAVVVSVCTFFFVWLIMRWKTTIKGIQTNGIEDLPLSVSEFIDEVINAMKYRRSVRADVRQELTDHFTDAMTDCETDDEKQRATKELIEGFGDVELLGRLLRRAKKRCRPLWRTMVVRALQSVAILFILLIVYIGWFFTGKPVISTNYLEVMNQKVRPVADDSQNAWPLYEQAAQGYIEPAKVKMEKTSQEKDEMPPPESYMMEPYEMEALLSEEEDFDQTPRQLGLLSEQERRILEQWISDNEKSLKFIRQGNQRSYYWQVYETGEHAANEMMAVLMPHLGEYQNLARLMCWQGLVDAESGSYAQAFDHILETYSLGQHLRGRHTTLIEQLVAMAIETISTNTMRMMLDEHGSQIDAAVLDSVRKRFSKMITSEDFKVDFGGEKLFMYDEAQRCFTKSRFGNSHLYFPRISQLTDHDLDEIFGEWSRNGFHILFTHPDKKETLREVEKFYSEMEQIAAVTPASANAKGLDIDAFTEEEISKNFFLNVLMPALSRVNRIAWRTRAEAEATPAILAILQYQKEHGRYPDLLDVLVEKGLLKEAPVDPFSDKPLAYIKTDDGFTLYSVGYNFTDDNGVPKEYEGNNKNPTSRRWTDTGDAIFWPVKLDN